MDHAGRQILVQRVNAMIPGVPSCAMAILCGLGLLVGAHASASVLDADGSFTARLGPDEAGYVSGHYRVLERERGASGLFASDPIRPVRFSDERPGLRDPQTHLRAELISFSPDKTRVFTRLLEE